MKILATDLDGTFLGGTAHDRNELYRYLQQRNDILLVFVTGRGLESVLSLLAGEELPYPDYIIGDVGATIVNAHSMEPIIDLQDEIEQQWPGHPAVSAALKHISGLSLQGVPQHRRCSFFVEDPAALEEVSAIVTKLGCDMVYSANRYLDILPRGVNKGSSLQRLLGWLDRGSSNVLVAGDTLNDLSLFQCGYHGVVVGNAEPALLEATRSVSNILYAKTAGAGGILEAIVKLERFNYTDGIIDGELKTT
jgi:sucrose-6F-phosphate phosphohydrolase